MNQLDVSMQQSIPALAAKGWSARKIARELRIDRETVRRYLRSEDSKPAIPPAGSAEELEAKPAIVPAGSKTGRISQCTPLAEVIKQGLLAGLSAQRIYQDLVAEHQFNGAYDAVKRFARRLAQKTQPPFRRMECLPGQELQVDFGQGAWTIENGQRRKTHLFRCELSHSRKGYSEAVRRQTSESFIRCLENAFRHYGGVSATVVIDYVAGHIIDVDG